MRRRELLAATAGANGYEYVDLGLQSKLKWAVCDVGAKSNLEDGNYYMYGKGSKTYDDSDPIYEGKENPLASSADTATQVMGGSWRMPTKDDYEELLNNTIKSEALLDNKVNGKMFVSKQDEMINVFFPYGYYYYERTEHGHGSSNTSNGQGARWTSTPYGDASVYVLYYYNSVAFVDAYVRKYGLPVRGVINI